MVGPIGSRTNTYNLVPCSKLISHLRCCCVSGVTSFSMFTGSFSERILIYCAEDSATADINVAVTTKPSH